MPIGEAYPALLVIDRAIASDQGHKYVYVLDAENKAQPRGSRPGRFKTTGCGSSSKGSSPMIGWSLVACSKCGRR